MCDQVSNWFINARVRLWKPMVEEMYQQESKEEAEAEERDIDGPAVFPPIAQTPTPTTNTNTTTPPTAATGKRSQINAPDNDPSILAINRQCFLENQPKLHFSSTTSSTAVAQSFPAIHEPDTCRRGSIVGTDYETTATPTNGSTLISFGTATGDVSLTLGLRHTGNLPEKSPFSVRDFGGC